MRGWLVGRPAAGYGFALLAWALATALRLAADPALPAGFPFLTFFPAVIITCFVAGTGPGMLCAALSGLTAWYFFIPPYRSFEPGHGTLLALAFYLLVVGVDVAIIHRLRRVAERLEAERNVSAMLAAQQKTLFAELQHRVANNLAFIVSLLSLKKRLIAAEPAKAATVIDEAIARIDVIGRIHRRLYQSETVDLDIGDHLRGLCADLVEATGASNVTCTVCADPVRLDVGRLTTLSLLVTELLTNSLKYAFQGRADGRLDVELKHGDDGQLLLTVRDDGPGMPADPPADRRTLGLAIVEGLAKQLGGALTLPGPGASATRLAFSA